MRANPTPGPDGALLDTVRVELLRWFDLSPAFRAMADAERRPLAASAAIVAGFLSMELGWLRDRPEARSDEDLRVRALQRAVATRLGLPELAGDADPSPALDLDDDTPRVDLHDFVAAMLEDLFGPVQHADADRLATLARCLSGQAARVTALGAGVSDADARAVARRGLAAELLRLWDGA